MTELMELTGFMNELLTTNAQVMGLDMMAVDREGKLVAFTGNQGKKSGCLAMGAAIQTVFERGEPVEWTREQRENCADCPLCADCPGVVALLCPVVRIGTCLGVLAFLTFREDRILRFGATKEHLINFLQFQNQMISNKIALTMSERFIEDRYKDLNGGQGSGVEFIGSSELVTDMLARARKAAATDSTVLIRGESGTGKEIIAKLIHQESKRCQATLVCVNCAAIPENLVESELFGYEEGAFTGAKKSGYAGKFEQANGGTIFLDEIGDMPMHVQTKLLRVLQEQTVEHLGGKQPIPVDVRVICATNKNLEEMIAQGRFRQDLYYRINIVPVEIAPLRLRREDIRLLIEHFVNYYNRKMNKNIVRLDADVWKTLYNYTWPGNVRELKNIIEYLENVAEGESISLHDLPEHLVLKSKYYIADKSLDEIMDAYERRILSFMVQEAKSAQDKTMLADHLKISRATLYRKMRHHGLI